MRLVDEGQPGRHLGHREDDVHAADGQQFLLACRTQSLRGALRQFRSAA